LNGLQTHVVEARALDGGERLSVQTAGAGLPITIQKPKKIDTFATVVELRFADAPKIVDVVPSIKPDADGSLTLKAVDAEIHGGTAQYEQGGGKDNIGFWTNSADFVSWKIEA